MELRPNTKAARPSDILRSQRSVIRQQEEIIEVLKGALAATGMYSVPAHAEWMAGLTSQERAMLGVLFARYPNAAHRVDILEHLPSYDHAKERQLQVVDVVIHKIRKKLGAETILTERGVGFRLGAKFYETLPKQSALASLAATLSSEKRSFA